MKNLFAGRINRTDFVLTVGLHAIAILGLGWIIINFGLEHLGFEIWDPPQLVVSIVGGALGLLVQISLVSLLVRRLHDLDRSGALAWLALLPIANTFFMVYLFLFPGTNGKNKYGLSSSRLTFFGVVVGREEEIESSSLKVGPFELRKIAASFMFILYIAFLWTVL